MVPPSNVLAFQEELLSRHGQHSWVIGEVTEGQEKKVFFGENDDHRSLEIIEVDQFVLDDF